MTMKLREDFTEDLSRDQVGPGPGYPVEGRSGDPNKGRQDPGGTHTPASHVMAQRREITVREKQAVCHFNSEKDGGEELMAIFRAVSTAETVGQNRAGTNPLVGIAGYPTLPAALLQTLIPIGRIEYGFSGINETLLVNLPINQLVKFPVTANYIRASVEFSQRYYQLITAGIPADIKGTWLHATDDLTRNNLFDNNSVFDIAAPPQAPLFFQGLASRGGINIGHSNADRGARAKRRFPGWIPSTAAAGDRFRCPIPRGAVTVALLSDDAVGAAIVGDQCFFLQNTIATVVGAAPQFVNFKGNQYYELVQDATSIDVYSAVAPTKDIAFELIYELGF